MDVESSRNNGFESRISIEGFSPRSVPAVDNLNAGTLSEDSQSGIIEDVSFADDASAEQAYLAPEDSPSHFVHNPLTYSHPKNPPAMDFGAEITLNLGETSTSVGFIAEAVSLSSPNEENKDVGSFGQHPFDGCADCMSGEEQTRNCKSQTANTAEVSPKNCENNVDVGSPPSFCEVEVDLKSIAGNASNSEEDITDMPAILRNPHSVYEDDDIMSRDVSKHSDNSFTAEMVAETPSILARNSIAGRAVTKATPPSSSAVDNVILESTARNAGLGEDGIEVKSGTENAFCHSESKINGRTLFSNVETSPIDSGNARSVKENSSSNVLASVQNNVVDSNRMGFVKDSSSSYVGDDLHVIRLPDGNHLGTAGAAQKTELEREMALYEAAEREEQSGLLLSMRVDEVMDPSSEEILDTSPVDTQFEQKRAQETEMIERKSKRGRKAQVKLWEDVCFVCFDGGKLILCDRRSCPKAYHVECTGRDPDFFEMKGAWFCGWHFCAFCSKSATMHCYTCSNAFCNHCIKEADFLCIRKNRGLCDSCFPIVKMIESGETVNADGVQVDFNDEETYEYLYKGYWEDLKSKISLTWEEVEKAEKAKEAGDQFVESRSNDTDPISEGNDGSGTDFDDVPTTKRRRQSRRKTSIKLSFIDDDDNESDYIEEGNEEDDDDIKPKKVRTRPLEYDGWATRELLDFIQLRKEDRKKPLSLVAVNKLLWSYIDDNKLQHPRRRGQIVCDDKLQRLFGKKSVGRFEMTKLLSSHLAPKQQNVAKANFEDDITEMNHNEERWVRGSNEKQRKPRKKSDEIKNSKADPNEFAAINVQNINLIYLRRALLEDLVDDAEFTSKVIGAFVRIRVPGMVNKNDAFYRLVQVVGIKLSNTGSPERRMSDVILEILNLQKREEVTVDQVSNQDFTEEECQRLRQCIKYGFIKAMTVGELEEKAKSLQEVKVKDWIDAELLRLSHLRDRASEKGRKRELRECVEKLQLLSSPAEKERRLNASVQITADPHMDPDFDSETEEDKQGKFNGPLSSWGKERGTRSWSIGVTEKHSNHWETSNNSLSEANYSSSWDNGKAKSADWGHRDVGRGRDFDHNGGKKSTNWHQALSFEDKNRFDLNEREFENTGWDNDLGRNKERDAGWGNQNNFTKRENKSDQGVDSSLKGDNQSGYGKMGAYGETPVFEPSVWQAKRDVRQQATSTLSLTNAAITAAAAAPIEMNNPLVIVDEKEKIWHYQDPTGKTQGPFSMEQLRKWEKTKLFPLDLKIWKTSENQAESILLMDALAGKFSKSSPSFPVLQPTVAVESSQAGWTGVAFGRDSKVAPMINVPGNDQKEQSGVPLWDQNGTTMNLSTWNVNSNEHMARSVGLPMKLQQPGITNPNDGWRAPVLNVEASWDQRVATGVAEKCWRPGNVPETGGWVPGKVPDVGGWEHGRVLQEGQGPVKFPETGGWGPGKVPETRDWGANKLPVAQGWAPGKVPGPGGWGHVKMLEGWGPGKMPEAGGRGQGKMPEEGQGPVGWVSGKVPEAGGWNQGKRPEEGQGLGGWGPGQMPVSGGWEQGKTKGGQVLGGWGPGKVPEAEGWGHGKMLEGQGTGGWGPGKVPETACWGQDKMPGQGGGWETGKVPETGGWGHGKMPEGQGPGGWGDGKMPEKGQGLGGWGSGNVPEAGSQGHDKMPEESHGPGCWEPGKVPDMGGWGHGKGPDTGGWGHGNMPEGHGPGDWGRSGFTAEDGAQGKIQFRQGWIRDPGNRDASQFRTDKSDFRNSRRKDIPCKFFARGLCRKGPTCEFKHAE